MRIRIWMTPIAAVLGLAAAGYGAFTGLARDSRAEAPAAVRSVGEQAGATGPDAVNLERMESPRECQRAAGIDRACTYM